MIDHSLVQRRAVRAGKSDRLLSLIWIAFFVKAVLAIGATLSLERASSLFVWVQ